PLSGKTNHDRVRKGPRLASKITDVFYFYGNFFFYFSPDRILKAFPRLDEPRDYAISAGGKVGVSCKKYFSFPFNCHYNGRRHGRIKDCPTEGTNFSVVKWRRL